MDNQLDAESLRNIFNRNFSKLKNTLNALPRDSVKLSLDDITLGYILKLKDADSTFYPLTFRKKGENEWEAMFNVDEVPGDHVKVELHRYEYLDAGGKSIGISTDVDSPSELAYGIRFWQTLYDAASMSKVPRLQKFWEEFKKSNLHIYKTPITGDPFKAGTIIFTLGQFKSADEIEKFILGEFMK